MRKLTDALRKQAWKFLANAVLPSPLITNRARRQLLRLAGVTVQGPAEIHFGLDLLTSRLTIGKGVFINRFVIIGNRAAVALGDDVALGPGVLSTTTHQQLNDPAGRAGEPEPRCIRIGRGTWVGARAVILPGVTIGAGRVIGAGAVVTQDFAPHGLYVGVPAHRVRSLDAVDGNVSDAIDEPRPS